MGAQNSPYRVQLLVVVVCVGGRSVDGRMGVMRRGVVALPLKLVS